LPEDKKTKKLIVNWLNSKYWITKSDVENHPNKTVWQVVVDKVNKVSEKENVLSMEKYVKETYFVEKKHNSIFLISPEGKYEINLAFDRRILTWLAKKRYDLLSEIMQVWLYNAQKVKADAFFDSTQEKLWKFIEAIQDEFNKAPNSVFEKESNFRLFVKQLFNKILLAEDVKDVIDDDDMKYIEQVILSINWNDPEAIKKAELQILNRMRKGWFGNDWDTEVVKEIIWNKLLTDKEILKKHPELKKVANFINSIWPSFSIEDIRKELEKEWFNDEELISSLIDDYTQIQNEYLKQEKKLRESYKKFCKNSAVKCTEQWFEKYRKALINATFAKIAQDKLLYYVIDKMQARWANWYSWTGTYASIVGLGW